MHKLLLPIFLSLFLMGCSSIPEKQLYTLTGGYLSLPKNKKTNKTILVLKTRAAAPYDTDKMAYVLGSHQISYYAKHGWVAEPAKQVTIAIVQTLEKTHHFRGVVASPFAGKPDYRLDTRLIRLEQVFRGTQSKIVFELIAQIIDAHSNKLIAEHHFQAICKAPYNNPYGGVIAANQAMQKILRQLAAFVIAYT